MELTPIFPAHIKPVRVGVYKTEGISNNLVCYSYWNGEWWGYYCPIVKMAYDFRKQKSGIQYKRWQGVLK